MAYIIKTQKGYIKRTSDFGPFYGRIVLTNDVNEAKRFTRKKDADERLRTAMFRTRPAEPDSKAWHNMEGTEHRKFGEQLFGSVEEVP